MSKQKAIEAAEKEIENTWKVIELLEALPEFENAEYTTSVNHIRGTVHITLPYDWGVYKQYRKLLGRGWKGDGWCDTQHSTDNSVSHHQGFVHSEFEAHLSISLRSDREGSTCERVQVGTKEVPVYEVRCG